MTMAERRSCNGFGGIGAAVGFIFILAAHTSFAAGLGECKKNYGGPPLSVAFIR